MPDLFGKTRVVNVKYDQCDIRIDRPSIFGNPHPVYLKCPDCSRNGTVVVHKRGEALELYKAYFAEQVRHVEFRRALEGLRGQVLGCHCKNKGGGGPGCHGDVIVEWLEGTR